jgi:hypothetical protein
LKTHNEEQVLTGCFWSFQLIGNPSKDWRTEFWRLQGIGDSSG